MNIHFAKAHGAKNDFLLTWADTVSALDLPETAIRLCDRYTGIGADGWLLVSEPDDKTAGYQAAIRLFNSDGSEAELSGNGTRCAAAFLIESGHASNHVGILTGAGVKQLRLVERHGLRFQLEMDMGVPQVQPDELQTTLPLSTGPQECALLDVGNPQCAVFVEHFDFNWRAMGTEIERHPRFPNRTNVSFIKPVDEHTIDVRFFERGAGETMSSGTGSTGAAAAAILCGLATSPVTVLTPAGPLALRWEESIRLIGPAEIVARGDYYAG